MPYFTYKTKRNILTIIGGVLLVTGTEIEHLTQATLPAAAAAENLAAGEPAHKDDLVRCGDLKALAIGLLLGELNVLRQTLSNGVRRLNDPNAFLFIVFTPFGAANSSHQQNERLTQVSRMKRDETHAIQHTVFHLLRHLVG